ncbi:TldD/PmbA family protein [Candidatus Woesearchaeota archaeon]|nr:TldD/PmbA family protein [Candidatus Woesearchaeota archaeon]
MNAEQVADYVLKALLKRRVDDAVVMASERISQQIKFSNNKVNAIKTLEQNSVSLFAVKDKRLVSTAIRDISTASADSVVDKVIDFLKSAPENKGYGGIAQGPFKYSEISRGFDKEVMSNPQLGAELVEQAISRAVDLGIERSAGVLELSNDDIFLKSSNSVDVSDKATRLYFSMRCFADKEASGHMVTASRDLRGFEVEAAVNKAAHIAEMAKKPEAVEPGKYAVLFDHLAFSNMLDRAGMAASAFSVEAGLSFLADRLGQKVASDIVTLKDSGNLENGFGSDKFDEEGVPTRENTIIESGKLNTYLHNTSTAKRFNTTTTANAGLVSPTTFNLVLKPGKHSFESLLSTIKRGLYITNVWYTRFQNYHSGDFSTIPRDGIFLIENGEIKHAVKELRVSDNMINLLQSISAIGSEPKQIFGWEVETPVVTPMAVVDDLRITKSEG